MTYPNWFKQGGADLSFARHLSTLPPNPRLLQIGAFTGDASKWLLSNTDGLLVDVDTWGGSDEAAHAAFDWSDVESTYDNKLAEYKDRHRKFKMTSDSFFAEYFDLFDFIYIDGAHTAAQVMRDALNATYHINTGGIIAFDDYTWNPAGDPADRPCTAIDEFLTQFDGQYTLLEKDHQVWISWGSKDVPTTTTQGDSKKIAVYAITKNEEQFVERWAASAKEADYIVLVDTGSTDSTVSVAQKAGCLVHEIKVSPWRFDDARNAALALVPSDADYCIALDADEMLVPGWRKLLDSVPNGATRPRYMYTWAVNDDGTPGIQYSGDKIHTRNGYRWVGPVHERLTPTLPETQCEVGVEVQHYPDPTKSRAQYLPLLELAVKEDPYNDRNSHYLAREYWGYGMYDKAAVEFKRHLGLGKWDAERARSMLYLSRIPGEDRLHWVLQAISIDQRRRENWYELSKHWYEQADWQQCLAAAEKALSIKDKSLDYMTDPEVWGAPLYDTAALAAWNTGKAELAVSYGEEAVRLSPNDGRLQENLRWYKGEQ